MAGRPRDLLSRPSDGRSGRRRRWPGMSSPPSLPRAGQKGHRDPANPRTGRRGKQSVVIAPIDKRVHPPSHAVELASQDLGVAVGLVDRPRNESGGIGPSGPPESSLATKHHIGNHTGHTEHVILIEGKILQPARPELLRVEEGAGRRRKRLGVAGPSQPLVSLRAVGWYRDEVAPLRPDHVLVQLVQGGLRALEPTASGEVGADGDDLSRNQFCFALDFGVPESVKGEDRLQIHLFLIGQDIDIGRLGRSQ